MALSKGVRAWLLAPEADPSVRHRVLTELLDKTPSDPAVVRARKQIGRKGWAAEILRRQHPRGQWETPGTSQRELYRPKYIATNWCLLVLADLGADGKNARVKKSVDLFLRVYASRTAGLGSPSGEVCFTGNAVRMLTKFGRLEHPQTQKAVEWLVRTQKEDGGWNCFPSKKGTLDGWEAMSAFASIPKAARSAAVERSIERGAEFYLERGLLREGRTPYAPWTRLHFPAHYYYDLLVGLDFMTALGYGTDPRMRSALTRLERMRTPDGTWTMGPLHPDTEDPNYPVRRSYYSVCFEVAGKPSRWITTTALAALKRAGR